MNTKYDEADKRLEEEIKRGRDSAKSYYGDDVPMAYEYGWLKGVARGYLIEVDIYKEELDKLRDKVYKLEDKLSNYE